LPSVHANPELAFEEKFAAGLLTKTVESHGLKVERGDYRVETAYAAEFGPANAPVMSLLPEFDALPGLGHACGGLQSAMGGAVAGQAIYGSYPTIAINQDDALTKPLSLSRGQFIPSTGVEQFVGRLALWAGVDPGAMLDPGRDAVGTQRLPSAEAPPRLRFCLRPGRGGVPSRPGFRRLRSSGVRRLSDIGSGQE